MQNHHLRLVPAALVALSGLAYAEPPTAEMPELPPNMPTACSAALRELPGISARIAAGNCLARENLKLVPVTSVDLETADNLATAVAPAIALFDNVIAQGDPYYSMLAEDARGDTYESMTVRLRRAARPDDEVARVTAEMLVANWRDNVALSTVRVAELAEKHPDEADRDQVISAITQRAASVEATQIATRSRR